MSESRRPARIGIGAALLVAALVGASASVSDAGQRPSAASPPAATATSSTPHHLVFIVLDQLRPEFITAFNMHNVQALMAGGTDFQNAYLGHMGSETVVSHNVMTSGILPKHMGWSDEWYRDSGGVLDAAVPDKMYVTRLDGIEPVRHPDQQRRLLEAAGLPAREVPRHSRRGSRTEVVRDVHDGRPERRHAGHVVRPQLRLRRRR